MTADGPGPRAASRTVASPLRSAAEEGVAAWIDTASWTAHYGYVEERYPGGKDGDPDAVPGIAPEAESDPDASSFILEVDGERFAVRVADRPGVDYSDTGYTWLSGLNKGYGFGGGGPSNPSLEDHRKRIREFLAMVDPTTGYIEDD